MTEEGILSQLTEVKHVKTYIKVRLAMLDGQEERIAEEVEEEKREPAIRQVKGRKRELEKLRQVVNEEGLKEYSQRNWGEVDG